MVLFAKQSLTTATFWKHTKSQMCVFPMQHAGFHALRIGLARWCANGVYSNHDIERNETAFLDCMTHRKRNTIDARPGSIGACNFQKYNVKPARFQPFCKNSWSQHIVCEHPFRRLAPMCQNSSSGCATRAQMDAQKLSHELRKALKSQKWDSVWMNSSVGVRCSESILSSAVFCCSLLHTWPSDLCFHVFPRRIICTRERASHIRFWIN